MNNKKIISLWIILLSVFMPRVFAVTAWTLKWRLGSDAKVSMTQIDWSRSIFNIISFVNGYLRFAIWFVCFLFMVVNGYKLITARGDEKPTSAATNALWQSVIWIAICLLAYIIVNVAVRLFA
jgi:hypothetical protein